MHFTEGAGREGELPFNFPSLPHANIPFITFMQTALSILDMNRLRHLIHLIVL